MQQPRKNGKPVKRKKAAGKRGGWRNRSVSKQYGTSKLETYFAENFLSRFKVNYVYEYEATDIRRFYDFAVVSTMPGAELITESVNGIEFVDQKKNYVRPVLLIEIDGGYWHSDPRVVKKCDMNDMQKVNKCVDTIKEYWCKKHNIPLLRFWEYDIKKDPSKVLDELKRALIKLKLLSN